MPDGLSGKHKVVFDFAGFGGHPRYTCLPCGVTCLRYPYLTNEDWDQKVRDFQTVHGETVHENAGYQ